MKSANDEVVAILKARGYRMTKAREQVIEALAKEKQPLSIQMLCAKVPHVDEASVYRTIRMLLDEELLEEITLQGDIARYALARGHHHHHAVCTSCGVMEHVACESAPLKIPSSFETIISHEVTLYGVCKGCADKI